VFTNVSRFQGIAFQRFLFQFLGVPLQFRELIAWIATAELTGVYQIHEQDHRLRRARLNLTRSAASRHARFPELTTTRAPLPCIAALDNRRLFDRPSSAISTSIASERRDSTVVET
jgi:hypothetical protein